MIGLVLGGADNLWLDIEAFRRLYDGPVLVFATNDAAAQYPGRVDYFVSRHANIAFRWREMREARGLNMDFEFCSCKGTEQMAGVDSTLDVPSGGTGMLALRKAQLHTPQQVLCGMPMDARRHIDGSIADGAGQPWKSCIKFRPAWLQWLKDHPDDAARVRSMSGWTRREFGYPDAEWFSEPVRKAG